MKTHAAKKLNDGDQCTAVGGTHAGKSGTVRDINISKTGHITKTVVQKSGVRFKTLGKNVVVNENLISFAFRSPSNSVQILSWFCYFKDFCKLVVVSSFISLPCPESCRNILAFTNAHVYTDLISQWKLDQERIANEDLRNENKIPRSRDFIKD